LVEANDTPARHFAIAAIQREQILATRRSAAFRHATFLSPARRLAIPHQFCRSIGMSNEIKRIGVGARMSEAVVYNGIVWVAGQVGNPGDSVADQTRQCLAEVDRILAEAGTDKTRILSTQIWLADMATFGDMNAVWDAWVPQGNTPARATGEAKLATPDYLVEVIVTAAV
jgi:enamine deaminase RidA (YjgF/YER057c/UK114 family)